MDPIRTLIPTVASVPRTNTAPPSPESSAPIENHPAQSGTKIENCLDFLSSDATVDRYHEIIDPSGWRLATYQKNPVFQNAHQHDNIIHTIGRALVTEVRQVASRPALFQRIHFAVDANPIAKIAFNLYKGGFLNAVSVGFIPIRWEDGTDDSQFRRRHLEQELLEVSAVAVPANPNAVSLASKSGALDKSTIQDTIDVLSHLISVPQSKIENQNSEIPDLSPLIALLRDLRQILKHL